MTWQIAFLILLLVAMAYLFLTAKLPVDLTAFLGLAVLILGGYVGPTEAFSGFASPAVITMLAIFILSASLLYTGIADIVASRIYKLVGSKEVPLIIMLMLVSGDPFGFHEQHCGDRRPDAGGGRHRPPGRAVTVSADDALGFRVNSGWDHHHGRNASQHRGGLDTGRTGHGAVRTL